MSDPAQTELPPISERFQTAYDNYQSARESAIELYAEGQTAEAQVWATLAVAAATVLAEPLQHCSKCCY